MLTEVEQMQVAIGELADIARAVASSVAKQGDAQSMRLCISRCDRIIDEMREAFDRKAPLAQHGDPEASDD